MKGNPGGLHYSKNIQNKWGARDQLKVQRHERLLEVFADIAYGTGSGYKSIQGLVLSFAGAPIAWQSSTQPFVCHSTATAGRATEALLCAMWGEQLTANSFERVIYGDNAAAIGLAHGNSSSSWRTRHLRVRSNILREAIEGQPSFPGSAWKLNHLKGTELVADGMTKPLMGQSFEGFQRDLGMKSGPQVKSLIGSSLPPQAQDHQVALRALLVGGLLVQAAEAQGEQDMDTAFGRLWLCGLMLVVIGAIWVVKTACTSVRCCLRRLQVLPSEVPDLDDKSGAEERILTTSSRLMRPRMRSSTTRMRKAAESESATEEEADGCSFDAAEVMLVEGPDRDDDLRVEKEKGTMRRRSSMARSLEKKGSCESSSSLSVSRERALQAACAAAEGAEKAAESAELAAQAAEQAAEQAMMAGQVAEQAIAASARLHQVVAQSSTPMNLVANAQASHQRSQRSEPVPTNPWNRFQHDNAGKGWSAEKMRAEYYRAKSSKRT